MIPQMKPLYTFHTITKWGMHPERQGVRISSCSKTASLDTTWRDLDPGTGLKHQFGRLVQGLGIEGQGGIVVLAMTLSLGAKHDHFTNIDKIIFTDGLLQGC